VEQLVGREAELQAIQDALAMPAPHGLLLGGEAGIGKTALWEVGITQAADRGMRVLVARPAEAEQKLSHAALGDLLAPLIDGLPDDFPAPQRRALDVALLRTAAEPGPLDPRAVGAATLGALRAATASGPLLVALDDVQWLDPASTAAVRFALRRLGAGEQVLVLATWRTGERRARPLDLGLPDERLTRIAVGPLGTRALKQVVRGRLGESVRPQALARLSEIAGGNPYFALELGHAALRQEDGADVPLPEAISAALHDRLSALPKKTRDALGAVAAMAQPTAASVSALLDPGSIDPAFDAGILREQGDIIRFDHPLLAEAAYRRVPPARRRALHEGLAEVTTDAEERARHLAAAITAPDAGVAAAIQEGAEAAAGRGAPSAAGELLEASARLEPNPDPAARRRIVAIGHYMLAGEGDRATALGRALVDQLTPGPLRSRALTALAQQNGEPAEMIDLVRLAAEEAGDDREALIEALFWEAYLLEFAGRGEEGYDAILRARELCGPDDARTQRVMVATAYAYFAHMRGDPRARELLREAAELEGDDLIPNAAWGAGTMLARTLFYADEFEPARATLEDRHRRAMELGDDESRISLAVFLSALGLRAGDMEAALRYADEAVALQGSVSAARALVAAYMGDVELARGWAEKGLATNEARGDTVLAFANRAVLAFLEFSLGDNAASVNRIQPIVERFLAGDAGDPALRHNIGIPDAIEALVALGRLAEAEELLGAWEDLGERFDRRRVYATAARCRAVLAAARGDVEEALRRAETALEHHRDLPVPFERARTLIVLGTLHRRARHKAAARAALEEALQILEGMGVPLWADRARAELGRIGGRAAADGLTPTEQRVADLVAEGRSNKEVAAELFVSVRTVEANLTRVYAKLGVRSRSELAATRQASDGRSRLPAPPPASRS
jgi:DNA-binding CsgD family transcriptional regulator